MKRLITTILAVCLSGSAHAEYDHTGDLEWTWDGSYKPLVQSGPGDFPSQQQANRAFQQARDANPYTTIDFEWLAPGKPLPRSIFLFACKSGGYDAYRHTVARDASAVHCQTFFMDDSGRKMYRRPVNFMRKDRDNWAILLPTRPRELPEVTTVRKKYFPPRPTK
ncbi:hypothetical protein ABIA23_006881 [Sinorhizobium fredii]